MTHGLVKMKMMKHCSAYESTAGGIDLVATDSVLLSRGRMCAIRYRPLQIISKTIFAQYAQVLR